MTGEALCRAAGVHLSYAKHAEETYARLSRKELLERAAAALKRDRFAHGAVTVTHTVDDSLLAAALLELVKE